MFLLTFNRYEDRDVKGVFSTVAKIHKYVKTVLNEDSLQWSDPAEHINGEMWANYAGGHLRIEPVTLNPKD